MKTFKKLQKKKYGRELGTKRRSIIYHEKEDNHEEVYYNDLINYNINLKTESSRTADPSKIGKKVRTVYNK